jgi:hypothetical protein
MSASPPHTNNANNAREKRKKAAKVGLMINVNKSKEMHTVMNNKKSLCIHNETTERGTQFAYLGSIIDNKGGMEADIMAQI